MSINKKQTISSLIRKHVFFSTLLVIILLVTTTLWVVFISYNNIIQTESDFFHSEQKELIKNEVQRTLRMIEEHRQEWYDNYKKNLILETSQAWELATTILIKQSAHHTPDEIRVMIEEALVSIGFFKQGGIITYPQSNGSWTTFDGTTQITINQQNIEPVDSITSQQIQTLFTKGEGFYTGNHPFRQDSDGMPVKSLFYVKRINALKILISLGNNNSTLQKEVQKEILNTISKIRYGRAHKHYIFVNQMDGKALLIHSDQYKPGDYINDIIDPDGINIFDAEKKAALQDKGGYVTYKWFQPNRSTYSKNITFVQHYKDWDWMIGGHTDRSYVEKILNTQRSELKTKLIYILWMAFILLIIAFVALQFYIYNLNRIIKLQVRSLLRNIGQAIHNDTELPDKQYLFAEFCQMAQYINKIIQEKQYTEKQYKISQNHFQTIYEHAPVMISGLDENNKLVLWNKECERIFGISQKAISKHPDPLSLFYNSEEAKQVKDLVNKADGTFRLQVVKGSNNKTRYQYWASFKTDENWTINVGYDITALKQSELKWNEQSRFLKSLIKSIPNPVFFKDAAGIYQFGNKRFANLIGRQEEDIQGLTVYDVSPPKIAEKYKQMDDALLKQGGVQVYESFVQDAEKGQQYFFFNKAVYKNLEGEAAGIIGVMLNITDRKKAEVAQAERQQALEEINRTKNLFFSIVAHDLKTPLHTILGFTYLLINAYNSFEVEETKRLIKTINYSAQNLNNFLDGLLTWVQSQLKGSQLELSTFKIIDKVKHELHLLQESIDAKGLLIENNIDISDAIEAEATMISTVIRNLVANAVKFSHRNGTIELNSHVHLNNLVVEIRDNGVGICKESQEKLFSTDVKTSTTGTESETGTGLGLLICKEFIEKHQGRIWVESEPNKGSSFFFSLPLEKRKKEKE
ncbi:MAG: cache domain-containing protein [Marinilabiliaceae bacterium]|nr:cache domain-containing protein [Marinilabiliaceae bacterium]